MNHTVMLKNILLLPVFAVFISFVACKTDPETHVETPEKVTQVKVPAFMRDSAFAMVEKQVAFGPRVPGSEAHTRTKNWLVSQFKKYGASVKEQSFKAKTATIGEVRATNIIASYNPTYAKRVVLAAHWDTRYVADADDARVNEPIDGADDGGSGVGVLLEIARLIQENPISLGVDIILFDAEDQGDSDGGLETWCLGAQYWAQNPHVKSYRAEFGILLDMVGAQGAVFSKEDLSGVLPVDKARRIHAHYDKVWQLARSMGQTQLFLDQKLPPVTDDHLFVNSYTDIPMIDIIHRAPGNAGGFGNHWHTHDDNMQVIDKSVLGAVGQVVLAYVYNSSKSPS